MSKSSTIYRDFYDYSALEIIVWLPSMVAPDLRFFSIQECWEESQRPDNCRVLLSTAETSMDLLMQHAVAILEQH